MADLLGAVGDVLGLSRGGEITKLLIESYEDVHRKVARKVFEAFINPDEYTLDYNVALDNTLVPGKSANDRDAALEIRPLEVSLKFYLDGTNAIPDPKTQKGLNIPQKIAAFHEAIGYDGKVHQPRYLRLIWGKAAWLRPNQNSFDCVLKSASVQYKLFDSSGSPLRVIINATFVELLSPAAAQAEDGKSSPDLTHVRIVKEGDTLPGLAQAIYGDFKHYLEIARVNKLPHFRKLEPGSKLYFPPFDTN